MLYAPAWQARTPAIVGTGPLLSSANALNSVSSGTVRLIGGPLGGFLLVALGIHWLISADALSYLLAAAAVFMTSRLTASLTGTAAGYFLLFTSSSLAAALPAVTAVGMFGSMSLVIPQTAIQRVIPNQVLGRVSAVFLTCEAAATLLGAAAGPFLAQAAGLVTVAATASLVTLAAAALTFLIVPRMPAVARVHTEEIPPVRLGEDRGRRRR